MSRVSIVTCTADQPHGFALAEKYMARQTVWGDHDVQWVVADNGSRPAACTMGQLHLVQDSSDWTPAQRFCLNMLAGLERVEGEFVFFVEDDDYYGPTHIERQLERLEDHQIAGDCRQRYYNVRQWCWKQQGNIGATMAQTAMRQELVPTLMTIVEGCLSRDDYGVDTLFWRWAIENPRVACKQFLDGEVLGIKGLPGRPGLGWGHRPDGTWRPDPDRRTLRQWIGDADADAYVNIMETIE